MAHCMQGHCRTQSPSHWFHLYSILNSLSILGTPTWLLVIFYGGIHQENPIFRHWNIHDKWSNSSHLLPWLSWGFLTAPLPSPPTPGFPCSSDCVPSHWDGSSSPRLDKVVKAGSSSLSVGWKGSLSWPVDPLRPFKHSAPDGLTDHPRRWEGPSRSPPTDHISHTISCFFKSQTCLSLPYTWWPCFLSFIYFCLCFHPSRRQIQKILLRFMPQSVLFVFL